MLIYVTDDHNSHRQILKNTLETIFRERGFNDFEIVECIHGADLLRKSDVRKPDLIFLDIHMPELDGLSTLVRYRTKDRTTPVIMASLETGESLARFNKERDLAGLTTEKKMGLLARVVERVRKGIVEEGKINNVLDAASSLRLDPIKITENYGANGYVNKPYKKQDIQDALNRVVKF